MRPPQLGVVAAQAAALGHPHLCALEDSFHHVHQALGGGGVAAVGNDDLAAGVAVAFELQHDALESAVLAAGLAEDVQFAHIAGLADDPDVEHPRHSGHSGLHPAIPGQIRQRFQREQQMGVVTVAQHLFADVVKLPVPLG